MSISGISNMSTGYAVKDDPLSLKKAMKAYQDNKLTGLTDEEREEIEKRANEYLEKYPIQTKQDRDAFNNYVKSLMKKFGFKGDIDKFMAATADGTQDTSAAEESEAPASRKMGNDDFSSIQKQFLSQARKLPDGIGMTTEQLLTYMDSKTAKIVFDFGGDGSVRIKEGLSQADYLRAKKSLAEIELWRRGK